MPTETDHQAGDVGNALDARLEAGDGRPIVTFFVDGQPWLGRVGDTIAAALYAGGKRAWRHGKDGHSRGLLCGMGICYDCTLTVDAVPGVRACQEEIRAGMMIETGAGKRQP